MCRDPRRGGNLPPVNKREAGSFPYETIVKKRDNVGIVPCAYYSQVSQIDAIPCAAITPCCIACGCNSKPFSHAQNKKLQRAAAFIFRITGVLTAAFLCRRQFPPQHNMRCEIIRHVKGFCSGENFRAVHIIKRCTGSTNVIKITKNMSF